MLFAMHTFMIEYRSILLLPSGLEVLKTNNPGCRNKNILRYSIIYTTHRFVLVMKPEGKHLFSFRIQPLRPPGAMVLLYAGE